MNPSLAPSFFSFLFFFEYDSVILSEGLLSRKYSSVCCEAWGGMTFEFYFIFLGTDSISTVHRAMTLKGLITKAEKIPYKRMLYVVKAKYCV